MIRKGQYKYIHYVDYAPELFDEDADPEEESNLAADPAYAGVLEDLKAELVKRVDPDKVNAAGGSRPVLRGSRIVVVCWCVAENPHF